MVEDMGQIFILAAYRAKRDETKDASKRNDTTAKVLLFDGVWQESMSKSPIPDETIIPAVAAIQ